MILFRFDVKGFVGMSKKLNIAVFGVGRWGKHYVRLFNQLPETNVVLVCDQQGARLEDIERQHPGVALTTSVGEALKTPGIDAAVVCTIAEAHYEIALAGLEAGWHLLVEKPMTTRTAHAEKLVEVADARNLTLMVGHIFIYNAAVQRVKVYLKENGSNGVYYVYARRTNLGPIRKDVNAVWDLASHDVSIFNYFLEAAPQWVSAVGSKVLNGKQEDVGFVSLGYPDNRVGHIHVSWAEPNKVREVVVVGSERRIVFNDLSPVEPVRIYEKGVVTAAEPDSFGEYKYFMRDGDIVSPKVEPSEPLKNQCAHFVECVLSGRRPISSGVEGLEVVRVMEAIDRSIAQNGAPVAVE
jgi:predicted dehydrogenase